MTYELIEAALNATLANNAGGLFQVVGYQQQGVDATQVEELSRQLLCYYSGGKFPQSGGSTMRKKRHDMTFKLEFVLAARSTADMAALEDPNSTPQSIAAALASGSSASKHAHDLMNAFYTLVWGILAAPGNYHLGLGESPVLVSNLWFDNYQVGDIQELGETVLLTASADVTATCAEVPGTTVGLAIKTIQSQFTLTTDIAGGVPDPDSVTAAPGVKVGP